MFPPVNNGGEGLASWAKVPFLGRIPMFTSLEKAAETGEGIISQGGQISVILTKIVNCIG
jgi:singapore isolate B (sub-type 7) whole genome shotgun sequence assembly, scaffold_7